MEYEREAIPDSLRTAVLERDRHRCRYCGATDKKLVMDHVYPVSRGGETSFENLVTACEGCNRKKYNKVGLWPRPIDYIELREYMIGLQRETDRMLFGLEIFIVTQLRRIHEAEGKFAIEDIGRISLRFGLGVFDICDFVDTRTNPHKSFRSRVERIGIEKFYQMAYLYDGRCIKAILDI